MRFYFFKLVFFLISETDNSVEMTLFKTLDCLPKSLTASEPQGMYLRDFIVTVITIFMIYIIRNVI